MVSKSEENGVQLITLNNGELTQTNMIQNTHHSSKHSIKTIIYASKSYYYGINGIKLQRFKIDDKSMHEVMFDLSIEEPEHFAFSHEQNEEIEMIAYSKGKEIFIHKTEDGKLLNEFKEMPEEISFLAWGDKNLELVVGGPKGNIHVLKFKENLVMEEPKELPEETKLFDEDLKITGCILDYPNIALSSDKGHILFSNLK